MKRRHPYLESNMLEPVILRLLRHSLRGRLLGLLRLGSPLSPAASPSPQLSPQLRAPSGACTAPSPPSWPSPPLSWPPPGRPAQLLRPRAAFDWAASPAPTTVLEDPPDRREEDTPEGLEGLGLSERRREGVAAAAGD